VTTIRAHPPVETPRCADCSALLPEPTEKAPEIRRCQDCWWMEQFRLGPTGCHANARSVVAYRLGLP
jgi:hypothetical protein